MAKRLGILTGGGDVPGLNTCIRAVVEQAVDRGWEVLGFRRGWAGPLSVDLDRLSGARRDDPFLVPLDRMAVRTIDRSGGTVLHTSRTDPVHIQEKDIGRYKALTSYRENGDGTVDATESVIAVLDRLGIDCMIPLGGDGTLRFTAHLHDKGVPIVAVPKTMDNDVFGTDYCIGFSTAVTRSVDAINALRTTVGSHERVGIVELFGRRSGETALVAGYLAEADRTVIAEVPVEPDRLARLIMQDREESPKNYAMLVVSEGARIKGTPQTRELSQSAARRTGERIGRVLGRHLQEAGCDVVIQELAYLMRSGPPDALDRMVAKSFGTLAVQLIDEGHLGQMAAVIDGNYDAVPVATVAQGCKTLDIGALYDSSRYRPSLSNVRGKPMFLT